MPRACIAAAAGESCMRKRATRHRLRPARHAPTINSYTNDEAATVRELIPSTLLLVRIAPICEEHLEAGLLPCRLLVTVDVDHNRRRLILVSKERLHVHLVQVVNRAPAACCCWARDSALKGRPQSFLISRACGGISYAVVPAASVQPALCWALFRLRAWPLARRLPYLSSVFR